jgi:hypothetical protein
MIRQKQWTRNAMSRQSDTTNGDEIGPPGKNHAGVAD